MADGQKLRWWHDEQVKQAAKASERVTPSPKPLLPEAPLTIASEETDTWAELEAEAARRSQQATTEQAESVSFFMNKSAILAKHRFGAILSKTLLGLYCGSFLMFVGWCVYWQWCFLHRLPDAAVLIPILWMLVSLLPFWSAIPSKKQYQQLLRKESPVIRLAPQGVFIKRPLRKEEFLSWKYVARVKPCRLLAHRYLEIRTTNNRTITIDQHDLVVPVDEIAARVAAYQNALSIIQLTD